MSSIGSVGSTDLPTVQSIRELRAQIDRLSTQLSSGKKATTLSELGGDVTRSFDLHARLSRLTVYDNAISATNTNLQSAINAINSFSQVSSNVETSTLSPSTTPDSTNRTRVKSDLKRQLSQMIDYLNSEFSDTYLFGGKQGGTPPVLDANSIIDGMSGKAGLKQYITERQQADLGANGKGRLNVSTTGSMVSINETVPGSVFGFTIKGIASGDAAISTNQPSGTPPQTSFTVSSQPSSGSVISVTLGLPDGTTTDISLTAGGGNGSVGFAIGNTINETATNIATALQTALGSTAQIQLAAASAKSAALDFFKGSLSNPPRRVAGPPYDSAIAFTAGTANNTVIWYQGSDEATDPRNDRFAKISDQVMVGFGARANETGFSETLAATALMAATNLSTTDEAVAKQQFTEMRDRARALFSQSKMDVTVTNASLMSIQKIAKTQSDEQSAQKAVFETALADVENAPLEQTAVSISSLQTQLQALYQLTAKLQSMTLANYL